MLWRSSKEWVDELPKDVDPKAAFSSDGLLGAIKEALAERMLNAELDPHLESEAAITTESGGPGNRRNGYSKKTVITDTSQVELEIPRDRRGTFEPQLIAKYQRRFPGFDALQVKMRDEGPVRNKAVYLAIGVTPDGRKDVLGIWIEQTEGAKFWMRVMSEIKNRGVNDILIAVVDGLKGFPDAINAVFPQTQIQTCIVHLLRNSMDYAGWKDRKPVATALKAVYRTVDAEAAALALTEFEDGPWGRKYPAITAAWRRHWTEVIPFFAYPPEVRRMTDTTNAIESLNSTLRRSVRTQFALLFGARFEMHQ
jgi:putative transposase